ncbi:MAG: response regulator [Deltaproteobacteria bacterium]|nr:response regulator [Deltaproteobacteria bacterium]
MPAGKILIVEDENCLLKLECILLTSKGYDVKGVTGGEEALGVICDYRPDLVLLDVIMPGMDGFEVCRRIKNDEKTRHIPVVMLTAKRRPQDIEKGMNAGAVSYITKPFKSSTVIETIQKCLQNSRNIS